MCMAIFWKLSFLSASKIYDVDQYSLLYINQSAEVALSEMMNEENFQVGLNPDIICTDNNTTTDK